MTEPADEATILQLLAELRSEEAYQRRSAAESIAEQKIQDERLLKALNSIAQHDTNGVVRNIAQDTLASFGFAPGELGAAEIPANQPVAIQPRKLLTRNEKWRDFLIGFVGWYVVNGAIWVLISGRIGAPPGEFGLLNNIFILGGNLLALLIFTFIRRWVALGILTSYGVNFLLAMMLGLMLNAVCWIPFFIK